MTIDITVFYQNSIIHLFTNYKMNSFSYDLALCKLTDILVVSECFQKFAYTKIISS